LLARHLHLQNLLEMIYQSPRESLRQEDSSGAAAAAFRSAAGCRRQRAAAMSAPESTMRQRAASTQRGSAGAALSRRWQQARDWRFEEPANGALGVMMAVRVAAQRRLPSPVNARPAAHAAAPRKIALQRSVD